MAELDGGRIAAMLAADTKLDVRSCLSALFSRHLHQLSNAGLVKSCKWIRLVDLSFLVRL